MKTSLIALLSAIIFLVSCNNSQNAAEDTTTDTVSTIDTVEKVDTVKKDTIKTKKSDRKSDEERDMKIMDDILKKKKSVK